MLHLRVVQQRHSFTLSAQIPPSMRKASVTCEHAQCRDFRVARVFTTIAAVRCVDRASLVPLLAGVVGRNCKVNFYNRFRVIFVVSLETSVTVNYYLCASKGNLSETLSFFLFT